MWNYINDRRILQSSKNSTTLLQSINYTKNNNNINNRKYSNEKYKSQIINQIYNKLCLIYNSNLQKTLNNNINDKSNYNNFINPNKRNIKKNIIRNSQTIKV